MIAILIIAALSIVPFIRTGITGIIDKTDADFPLYPSETFFSHFYLWSSQLALGFNRAIATTPQLFPYYSVIAFLSNFGLAVGLVERVWLVSIFFLLGASIYYLMLNLIPSGAKGKYIGCLIAAVFYMFNPFTISYLLDGEHTALLVHAAMPLFFAFVIKALSSGKGSEKYVLMAGFVSMAFQSADPGVTLITLIPVTLYLMYHILTTNHRINAAKSILFLVVVCFSLNAWWIIPMAQALSYPGLFSHLTSYSPSVLTFASERLQLVNVVRLWYYYFEQLTPNLLLFVSSELSVIVGFALAILGYSALLLKPKNKYVLFFGLLATISTIFSLGISRPWGFIYDLMWNIFPPFLALRNPYKFVGILAFAYAILIGMSLIELYNKLRNKFLKRFLVLAAVFLIAFNASPLITGEYFIFQRPLEASIDQHFSNWLSPVNIPTYYANFRDYLNNQTDEFNILILPEETWLLKYTWSPYDFAEILKYVSPKPVVFGGAMIAFAMPSSLSLIESSYSAVNKNSSYMGKILALMNVKYLLVRNDTESFVGKIEHPASYVKDVLNSQQGINLEKSFGMLDLYRNEYWQPLHFSTPSNGLLIYGDLDEMIQVIGTEYFTPKSALVLSEKLGPSKYSTIYNEVNRAILPFEVEDEFTRLEEFGISADAKASNGFVLALSQPTWVDDSFKEGWQPFDAQGATPVWSTDGDIVSLGINSPDAGSNMVSMKRDNIKIDIQESPYSTIKAKTTNATMHIGFRIENSTGHTWDLTGSTWSPFSGLNVQNSGWVTKTNNIYESAKLLGINDKEGKLFVTEISYYTYNNGAEGTSYTYVDHIAFSKFEAGSAKPAKAIAEILIPKSGNYAIAFRVATGQDYGKIVMTIDGKESIIDSHSNIGEPVFAYLYEPPIYLNKGNHEVVIASNETVKIDSVFFYSCSSKNPNQGMANLFMSEDPEVNVSYTKIDPTKYSVYANFSSPFYLVFSESYHIDWVAYIEGQRVPNEYHFTANGFANGWYINKTGSYTITVEFKPQILFYAGAALSIIALVICIIYVNKFTIKVIYKKIKEKHI